MPGFHGVRCTDLRHEANHRETAEQEHGAERYILREDTNGWIDGRTDGRTDRRTYGQMDARTDGRIKEQTTDRHRKAWMNA